GRPEKGRGTPRPPRGAQPPFAPTPRAFPRGETPPGGNGGAPRPAGPLPVPGPPGPRAPPLRRRLRCRSAARRRIDRALCSPDTRERGPGRPNRGLQLSVSLLRRPVRGLGRVRTREGRGEAGRRGAGALA